MAGTREQDAWIARVLGVALRRAAPPLPPRPRAVVSVGGRALWAQARDSVNEQIEALRGHLRGVDDPELQRIAEFGLNGATGKLSVGLMAALVEADAGATPQARKKARDAVATYRAFLGQDALVRLLDENPFVPINIRGTLGSALAELDQALAA